MKKILVQSLLAALLCAAGPAAGADPSDDRCCAPIVFTTDAQFCADIQKVAAEMKKRGSVPLDSVTRDDGMEVACETRTVVYKRSATITAAKLKPGWQADKLRQWDDDVCKNELLTAAMKHGWTLTSTFTFSGGQQFHFTLTCPAPAAKP